MNGDVSGGSFPLTGDLTPHPRWASARWAAGHGWHDPAGIQSGELSGRLDSIAVLAKRYGVSVKTIRNALAVLTDEGLVRGFAGSGTFVVPPSERL